MRNNGRPRFDEKRLLPAIRELAGSPEAGKSQAVMSAHLGTTFSISNSTVRRCLRDLASAGLVCIVPAPNCWSAVNIYATPPV